MVDHLHQSFVALVYTDPLPPTLISDLGAPPGQKGHIANVAKKNLVQPVLGSRLELKRLLGGDQLAIRFAKACRYAQRLTLYHTILERASVSPCKLDVLELLFDESNDHDTVCANEWHFVEKQFEHLSRGWRCTSGVDSAEGGPITDKLAFTVQ